MPAGKIIAKINSMLLSMTGYGRATKSFGSKKITLEIRSLNSKFTDVRFRIPGNYREKENDMRRIISDHAKRGKMDVNIDVESMDGDSEFSLNVPLFKKYYTELTKISGEMGAEPGDLMAAILRIPNVVGGNEGAMSKEEWKVLQETLQEALANFTDYRVTEGAVLEKDLHLRATNIQKALEQVDPFEVGRIERLRTRLKQNLEEFLGKENVDENRFEQEIIFYLEKIDITEEKVRLQQNCKYFLEELASKKTQKGRKLSFISQEIGREINTLGAKAYSADIQKLVVDMKDDLEKIKEQIANAV